MLAATSTVVLACWTLLAGSQWGPEAVLQPTTYRSPSGEYELLVDPTSRHGEGKGSYRMSFRGEERWSREHPFTFQQAVVADNGSSAGYAYSEGPRGLGELVVAMLDPSGGVRFQERTKREPSRYPEGGPTPWVRWLLQQPRADLLVVGVSGTHAEEETWHTYRMSAPARLGDLDPRPLMADPARARWSLTPRAVPDTDLILSHWWMRDEKARFCLVDSSGDLVWQLDLPGDHAGRHGGVNGLKNDHWEDRAILSVGPGPGFELRFVKSSERVRFEVLPGPNGWLVAEKGRAPCETEPGSAEPALEVQDVELRVLGRVSFATENDSASPAEAGAVTVDHSGRVYLLDSRSGTVHVFDAEGKAFRLCHPEKGDWGDGVHARWMSVRGDGTLFVGGDGFALEFAPDGTRRRRLLLDELEGDWTFVPGRREHWRHFLDEIELVDAAGRSVRSLERTAENEWLESPLALGVARDGSVAVVDEAGPRIHFYGPAGEPRGSAALPEGGFYYLVAYDGASAVVVGDPTDLLVAVPGGAPLRRFPTGLQSISGLFFSPDGTELWVFRKTEMLRYAVP